MASQNNKTKLELALNIEQHLCFPMKSKPGSLLSCSLCRFWEMFLSSSELSMCCRKGWILILMSMHLSLKLTFEVRWVFSLVFVLDFSFFYQSLNCTQTRQSGQSELVIHCSRTHKHTEKSQVYFLFVFAHHLSASCLKQTDVNVAASAFCCQVFSFGINIFSAETV